MQQNLLTELADPNNDTGPDPAVYTVTIDSSTIAQASYGQTTPSSREEHQHLYHCASRDQLQSRPTLSNRSNNINNELMNIIYRKSTTS